MPRQLRVHRQFRHGPSWNADYRLSAETRKHLDRENEVMKTILTDPGLVK